MAIKLIANRHLTAGHLLSTSAGAQSSPRFDIEKDPDNAGSLRPVVTGTPADESLARTTTGAGTTTTIVDSNLFIYGDSFWVGAAVTITGAGHAALGESRAVTGFTQSSGTLAVSPAFSAAIGSGVAYTLVLDYASRRFTLELVGSGNPGQATFKWKHAASGNEYQRGQVLAATWLTERVINATIDGTKGCAVVQAANGDILVFANNAATSTVIRCWKSSNNGVTWSLLSEPAADNSRIKCAYKLRSGRILLLYVMTSFFSAIIGSDDHGATWSAAYSNGRYEDICELENGNLVCAYGESGIIMYLSYDSGATYDDFVVWDVPTANARQPSVCQAADGALICCYSTDIDVAGSWEIKCGRSTDGGMTWSIGIVAINYASANMAWPRVRCDVNGTLICVAQRETADKQIVFAYSTDHGVTWTNGTTVGGYLVLKSTASTDFDSPRLALINGAEWVVAYLDQTNNDLELVRRGRWEVSGGIGIPCAHRAMPQRLICGLNVQWYGAEGIVGDKWEISIGHDMGIGPMIEADSLQAGCRSTADNADWQAVFDAGANDRFLISGIGLFNCNLRTVYVQLNASDSWSDPSVNELVSFDLATGTVDASGVAGNLIKSAGFSSYAPNSLKGAFIRMTSGTDSGLTWRIAENWGGWLRLDTISAHNIAAGDTFAIFQAKAAKAFTGGAYQYLRIFIPAQHTADGYYQIGKCIPGVAATLSSAFTVDYQQVLEFDDILMETPDNSFIAAQGGEPKTSWSLTWEKANGARAELLATLSYIRKRSLVFIPDDIDMLSCYLVKHTGDKIAQKHIRANFWDVGKIDLKEV